MLFACGISGATHTFMWVGKRVQRAAHKAHLPQQVGLWRWEPISNEYANAYENEPKRVVDIGRCNLGATAKRGSPLGGSDVQSDGAVAPQVEKCPRQFATQPAQRGAALCEAPPRTGFICPLEERSSERQTKMCIQGVQPCKSSEIHDSGSAAGRLDGADLCAQDTVSFCVRS